MEYGASERVVEQSQMGTTIKIEEETAATSTVYFASEIELNDLKHKPQLVQSVKCEPAILVTKEIVENTSGDDSEQQCAPRASIPAGVGSLYEANRTSQGDRINVKLELEELDIGPTVLQHMDIHYALNKSTVDGSSEAMRCSTVKEDTEDKLRDSQATSHNCDQTTAELDYDEERMKSHLLQQKDQHCTTSSNSIKYDKTSRKSQLLSVHNKLHQRNSRQAAMAGGTVANTSYPYQSKICEASFAQSTHLIQHVNSAHHTVDKPYQCRMCDARFATNGELTQHVRIHTDEKPHECQICGARFVKTYGLTQHLRIHTGEKPHKCKICDARFARRNSLIQHARAHTSEKHSQCNICDEWFASSDGLTLHIRLHTGEKPYQCKICDAKFTESDPLTRHMIVHAGEKPYQCNICDARFARNGDLTRHMRVHTGEKPYQCTICNARFAHTTTLTRHMRVHTDEKRYQYKICNARFAHTNYLARHMRRVHRQEALSM